MEHNKYIRELIDKYLEGATSLKEEETLRDYFQGEKIPEEWKVYQAMFRYFIDERQKTETKRRPLRSVRLWMPAVAAACVALFFGLKFLSPAPPRLSARSLIYIDGKKYTDIELIQTETLRALENLSDNEDNVYSSQVEALDLFFSNN
ncbi:MAG: hypothetical protein LBS46_09565 [Dysgonamonadaceae bacterium]|jgi:hypothetical protein|nr:hypothetical protein [Dysgonamonadaceae bacterium]